MPPLNSTQRVKLLSAWIDGARQEDLIAEFNISKNTFHRIVCEALAKSIPAEDYIFWKGRLPDKGWSPEEITVKLAEVEFDFDVIRRYKGAILHQILPSANPKRTKIEGSAPLATLPLDDLLATMLSVCCGIKTLDQLMAGEHIRLRKKESGKPESPDFVIAMFQTRDEFLRVVKAGLSATWVEEILDEFFRSTGTPSWWQHKDSWQPFPRFPHPIMDTSDLPVVGITPVEHLPLPKRVKAKLLTMGVSNFDLLIRGATATGTTVIHDIGDLLFVNMSKKTVAKLTDYLATLEIKPTWLKQNESQ